MGTTFLRECSAQKLTTQGQFIGESGEGVAFAGWDYLLVFKIVAQMLRPYGTE